MENPKIRFKGFTKDWEQRKLGDVAQEFKSGNSLKADEIDITGDYPVYGGNGLRGYTSTYNHDGEYALIGRQGALCGNMNYSAGKAYFTEHAVVVKADENNDTSFLYYMLDTMNLGQYSDQSAQPGLAVNKLVKLGNSFPKKEEQQQIGTYFRSLDHLITLHQRKCEQTKKLKKYMLQKMFPQNGAKVPEIRFDGFTYDWEQRKFGSLLEETRNKTIFEDEDTLLSCAIDGMYLNSELFSHFRGSSNIGYLKVKKNDLILSAQNLHLGNCNVNLRFEHGIISPAYKVYELVGCNPLFMQAWVKKDSTKDFFLKSSTEGASVCRKNIVWEELYKQELPVPSIEEQTKVGEYFYSLDHLITLHQRKCDELKKMKKYMLQNMFI